MTDWSYSLVMIVPASLQDAANRLACALGHDVLPGHTFSVPLSADGSEPATHFGCRTAAQQSFLDLLSGAAEGALPDLPWADYGITEQDIADVLASLISDAQPASEMIGHFDAALAANDLVRVVMGEAA